jgi:tetratricopeptide (TPR) repeat protein
VIGADLVKQQKYTDAIPHLELALSKKSNNAITLIYLGFSHRMIGAGLTGDAKNGEFKKALGYYQQALTIDPNNKLLHEYLGKLYLLMHDQTSAENELKTLETLCPSGCEERDTLSNVMLEYAANMALSGAPSPAPPPKGK